jgi:hypothetical protein
MYTGTPGAEAFKTLEDWIVGATYNGCTAKAGNVTCNFAKGGKPFVVLYTDSGAAKKFAVKGSYSQVCSLDGTCKAMTGKSIVTNGPVRLSN